MMDQALIDEVETLREENRQLRELLAVDQSEEFVDIAKSKLRIMPSTARLLYVLVHSVRTSKLALYHAYCRGGEEEADPKIIDIHVHKLRRAFDPHEITIETQWGFGYRLSPENRAKVPLPARTGAAMSRLITEGPKAGRQPCCIMGCGRTFKDEGYSEVICGKHWRMADKRIRRLVSKVERRAKREGWTDRLLRLHGVLWSKGRQQAQERALGI